MGYEPGDPVRVVFPFEKKGKKLVREGVVIERLGDGCYRIVFDRAPRADGCEVDVCEVEQAVVSEEHFS